MTLPHSSRRLSQEASLPIHAQEKVASWDKKGQPSFFEEQRRAPSRKMSARRILLSVVVCLLVTMGLASAVAPRPRAMTKPCHEEKMGDDQAAPAVEAVSSSSFSKLLGNASPDVLHDLLHKYFPETFRHGVWASEQQAMEAVHRVNAALATTIVKMAKRDGGNTTTSGVSESTSSASVSLTETTTATSATSATSAATTAATTPSTTSAETTSTTETKTVSTTATVETTSTTTSSSSTATTPTSTKTTGTTTGGTTLTTATTQGTTSETSYSSILETTTYTSTNSNGGVVVVTATTFVNAEPASTTGTSSTQAAGSLQTNAAPPQKRGGLGFEVVVGAMIGGVLMA